LDCARPYLQVQDQAGHWSNALDVGDRRRPEVQARPAELSMMDAIAKNGAGQ
jgi:hypothetical protein